MIKQLGIVVILGLMSRESIAEMYTCQLEDTVLAKTEIRIEEDMVKVTELYDTGTVLEFTFHILKNDNESLVAAMWEPPTSGLEALVLDKKNMAIISSNISLSSSRVSSHSGVCSRRLD
jgi:hypothetical protein